MVPSSRCTPLMENVMRIVSLSLLLLLASTTSAQTFNLTFDPGDPIGGLTVGTTLSNQYAAFGVSFTANAFSGAGGPTGNWAANTDLTVVSSTGTDVGGLGTPALVSGNIIRSFDGWLNEDGDSSLTASFTVPVSSVSVTFAGISSAASTRIFALDSSNNILGTVVAPGTGQQTLTFTAGPGQTISTLQVTPGDFNDWVGFDNFSYTVAAVPEPSTIALVALTGVGIVAAIRRRYKQGEMKLSSFARQSKR